MDGVDRGGRWLPGRWEVVDLVVDVAFAAAAAAVLAPTTITLMLGSDSWPPSGGIALSVLVAAAHLTVAARRRYPRAAYAVCCAVMLAIALAPDFSAGEGSRILPAGESMPPILLPSALVYPIVLYSVAGYTRRPWPAVALGIGLTGAVVTTVRLAGSGAWRVWGAPAATVGWILFTFAALIAAVVAPWGLGRYRAVRVAYVAALEERARRAEQDRRERAEQSVAAERARIAREMHDIVAHSLAVIVRQAEGGRFAAAKDPAVAVRALGTVAEAGREALADMRAMLAALREAPTPADDAPQPSVEDLEALVERVRAAGLPVDLTVTGAPLPMERAASLAAYRLVQEALTNVVKHAGPGATARVSLAWGGALAVTVTDDGGARPLRHSAVDGAKGGAADGAKGGAADAPGESGQGLIGMRERVVLAGGQLEAGPEGAGGFAVRARLPVRSTAGQGEGPSAGSRDRVASRAAEEMP